MTDDNDNGNWVEIDGRKEWVPGPSAWPVWLAVIVGALAMLITAAICSL